MHDSNRATNQAEIRTRLVATALEWEAAYGVGPAITTAMSERDAAILLGMSDAEYRLDRVGRTAPQRGPDFTFRQEDFQIKANRPSGKPGSFVTKVPMDKKFEFDHLIWILYDSAYAVREAWRFDVATYRARFEGLRRLAPSDMRQGSQMDLSPLS